MLKFKESASFLSLSMSNMRHVCKFGRAVSVERYRQPTQRMEMKSEWHLTCLSSVESMIHSPVFRLKLDGS
jgi:hypothetical protein